MLPTAVRRLLPGQRDGVTLDSSYRPHSCPVHLRRDLKAKYDSAKSHAEKTQHEGKLNAQVNHMIDVASYWACACQRPLTLDT